MLSRTRPAGELRAELSGHSGVTAVAIAPDGTWLASADDRSVRTWDPTADSIGALMRVDH